MLYSTSHQQAGNHEMIRRISLIFSFLEQVIENDQEKKFNSNPLCEIN